MALMRVGRRAAAVALAGWCVAAPAAAQNRDATPSVSLSAAIQRAASQHADRLTQTDPRIPKRMSCGKKAAIGASVGAGVGLATGLGVLAATGGSDSFYRVLFNFVGMGTAGGVLAGTASCAT